MGKNFNGKKRATKAGKKKRAAVPPRTAEQKTQDAISELDKIDPSKELVSQNAVMHSDSPTGHPLDGVTSFVNERRTGPIADILIEGVFPVYDTQVVDPALSWYWDARLVYEMHHSVPDEVPDHPSTCLEAVEAALNAVEYYSTILNAAHYLSAARYERCNLHNLCLVGDGMWESFPLIRNLAGTGAQLSHEKLIYNDFLEIVAPRISELVHSFYEDILQETPPMLTYAVDLCRIVLSAEKMGTGTGITVKISPANLMLLESNRTTEKDREMFQSMRRFVDSVGQVFRPAIEQWAQKSLVLREHILHMPRKVVWGLKWHYEPSERIVMVSVASYNQVLSAVFGNNLYPKHASKNFMNVSVLDPEPTVKKGKGKVRKQYKRLEPSIASMTLRSQFSPDTCNPELVSPEMLRLAKMVACAELFARTGILGGFDA